MTAAPLAMIAVTAVNAAMDDEPHRVVPLPDGMRSVRDGRRDRHAGALDGVPVVVAQSGIGNVAAAATVALPAARFAPRALPLAGVAGGLAGGARAGADVAIRVDFVRFAHNVASVVTRAVAVAAVATLAEDR